MLLHPTPTPYCLITSKLLSTAFQLLHMLSSTLTVPFQITSSHVPCPSCAKPHRTAPFQLNPEFSGQISFSFLCLQLFAPSYGLSGHKLSDYQFSSVAQSCPTLCDPMNRSTPGLPVHHYLPEFTQTHVHRVSDAIQPSHPLLSPSPPAPHPSQHQGLFQ